MGGCSSKVGYTSTGVSNPPPPPQDREEVYHDLHIYLKESYTKANKLQEAFADEVIVSPRLIKTIRKKVEEERSESNEAIPLSDEEAKEIVNNVQKEKDWLIGRQKIFTDVLAKLQDFLDHEACFAKKHKTYGKLILKIKPDVLSILEERIKYIGKQPSCSILDAQRADDSGTDAPSKNREKDSSKCQEQVSDNESNSGVETGDKPSCTKRQQYDFKLLYECTLTLECERNNFFKIYLLVKEHHHCKIL